jgi:hypothetical protein
MQFTCKGTSSDTCFKWNLDITETTFNHKLGQSLGTKFKVPVVDGTCLQWKKVRILTILLQVSFTATLISNLA